MRGYWESLGLSILAVFLPIKPIILVMLVLVLADLALGIYSSWKAGRPLTSGGIKRTVVKLLVYETAICIAFLVHQYLIGDLIPAEKIIATTIGLTELKSILEHLDEITGQNTFQVLLDRLTSAQKESGPK